MAVTNRASLEKQFTASPSVFSPTRLRMKAKFSQRCAQSSPEHVSVDRLPVAGHFGNPIIILTARTEKASETRHIIGAIKKKLPKDELMELRERSRNTSANGAHSL